jgi:hypothetical protein
MLDYKTKKYINKETFIFGALAFIGITVLILGTFFNILRDEMMGICLGSIPTGVFGVILTQRMKSNPEKADKMVRIKTEERMQLIRYKAGNFTFWSIFLYIFVFAILSRYIPIGLPTFLSITLVVMAVVHIISSIIYHKIL